MIVKVGAGVVTNHECEALLSSLQAEGLISDKIPCIQLSDGFVSVVSIQG
jgi:hypothetical protein